MSGPGSASEGNGPHSCVTVNLMPWPRLETAAEAAVEEFHWQWWQTVVQKTMVEPAESQNTSFRSFVRRVDTC